MESKQFGAWLRRQLLMREWSQADLARRLATSTGVVSRWARDERTPDPASCDLIADVLSVDRDVVLAVAGHRPVADPIPEDDPRVRMHGLIDHTDWAALDPQTVAIAIGTLESYQRAASRAAKPRAAS